jgi:glycosyltransferase involved in cell wall biosynthesis
MLSNFVMMIGPDIESKGGISSVIRNYIKSNLFLDFDISYYPSYHDGTALAKILFYLKKLIEITLHLNRYKIVHLHSSYGMSFRRLSIIFWIAVAYKKNTVFHIHSGHFYEAFLNAASLERWLIRKTLRQADIVIVLSPEWMSAIRGICPEARIEIVENPLEIAHLNHKRSSRPFPKPPYRILFMGRLEKHKGVYDIIEAASWLPRDRYIFILAGNGEIRQVKEKIQEKGLRLMFEILGWISGEQKHEMLQTADLFLLPSYQEGLPMSVIEAMAASLPILATTVGGVPHAVEDKINGYLIPPGNPEVMAKTIELVFSDQKKWKHFSDRSYQIAQEKFNVDKIKNKLKRLYEELLQNKY